MDQEIYSNWLMRKHREEQKAKLDEAILKQRAKNVLDSRLSNDNETQKILDQINSVPVSEIPQFVKDAAELRFKDVGGDSDSDKLTRHIFKLEFIKGAMFALKSISK